MASVTIKNTADSIMNLGAYQCLPQDIYCYYKLF